MRLIHNGISFALVAVGSFWLCCAIALSSSGLAVCGMAVIGLAGMFFGFEPEEQKTNRYVLRRKVFGDIQKDAGIIASYRGLRGTIEIYCRATANNKDFESPHVFLDKEEAKNFRDMLSQ